MFLLFVVGAPILVLQTSIFVILIFEPIIGNDESALL